MKISKSLLQNIAVGLLVAGSITSCEVDDDPIEFHNENCTKNCSIDHLGEKGATEPETTTIPPEPPRPPQGWDWENCLACGMG